MGSFQKARILFFYNTSKTKMITNIPGKLFLFKDPEGLVIPVIHRTFEKGMPGLFHLIDADVKVCF